MLDYARNLQLALNDRLRRGGLVAGAALALLMGAGFLLAALWVWLAHHLGWGALGASLAIGAAFLLGGLLLLALARHSRHAMPASQELKDELSARLQTAAKAAVGRAADATLRRAAQAGRGGPRKASAFAEGAAGARPESVQSAEEGTDPVGGRVTKLAPLVAALAIGVTLAARLRGRGS